MRAQRRVLTLGCTLAVLAGGCTITRSGNLTSVSSSATIPIKVAVGAETATMNGTDPATGERLQGTFHLQREEREPGMIGLPGPAPAVGGGAVSPGTGPRPATAVPDVLNLSGRLEGDKGTSLRCVLQVKKGIMLEGVGACRSDEGEEGLVVYRIKF